MNAETHNLLIDEVRPTIKSRVIDLVEQAGIDVSKWAEYKGQSPAANPKFCYEWAFVEDDRIVLSIWTHQLAIKGGEVVWSGNINDFVSSTDGPRRARAIKFREAIKLAYLKALNVNVIVCHGQPRRKGQSEKVQARGLDSEKWSVVEFDPLTGQCEIVRGLIRGIEASDYDFDMFALEGLPRQRMRVHRSRELQLRQKKIELALLQNDGRLVCEVPGCGFDFLDVYGESGRGFAHVHHEIMLSTAPEEGRKTYLSDLKIVCANCHAMIHVGGGCRRMLDLICKR
jgi:5-methylcytosine-specific restriction enzyme A